MWKQAIGLDGMIWTNGSDLKGMESEIVHLFWCGISRLISCWTSRIVSLPVISCFPIFVLKWQSWRRRNKVLLFSSACERGCWKCWLPLILFSITPREYPWITGRKVGCGRCFLDACLPLGKGEDMGCTLVLVVAERLKRCCRVVVVPGFPHARGLIDTCRLFFPLSAGSIPVSRGVLAVPREGRSWKSFLHNLLPFTVLVVFLKKDEKKRWKNLENGESLLYLCTRFRERGREGKRLNEGPEKKFEKKAWKVWRMKNKPYLCSRFREGRREGRSRARENKRQRVL